MFSGTLFLLTLLFTHTYAYRMSTFMGYDESGYDYTVPPLPTATLEECLENCGTDSNCLMAEFCEFCLANLARPKFIKIIRSGFGK